jgi:hypothetical protein
MVENQVICRCRGLDHSVLVLRVWNLDRGTDCLDLDFEQISRRILYTCEF